MLTSETAARLQAIGDLGFCNPFGPERPRLEARIVGEETARAALWNRPVDWPLTDPVLPAIQREAERQVARVHAELAAGATPSAVERDLIRGAAQYALYYRYDARFFDWITAEPTPERVDFYDDFREDFHALFHYVGPPPWAREPADLFSLFFQTRRAFHFVFHQILGSSDASARLRASVWESLFTHDVGRYVERLHGRMHEISTLILGASGTGKELVASALGLSSFIRFDPASCRFERDFRWTFHPLHIAALSKTLIESDLFGHKRGAFTGADRDRKGHFEDKSATDTVFLDEIGELDAEVQVKLLRVLESRSFHRLGDSEPRAFGGKIVAATHRDLGRAMGEGRFREDLYYRLCADIVRTPSLHEQLRDGPDELGRLVTGLLQRSLGNAEPELVDEILGGIDRSVGFDYRWPGNMRELEQCVRNLLVHGRYAPAERDSTTGGLELLFDRMRRVGVSLDEVTETYSTWAYSRAGSYAHAGRRLGVDRRTVAKHVDAELLADFGGEVTGD